MSVTILFKLIAKPWARFIQQCHATMIISLCFLPTFFLPIQSKAGWVVTCRVSSPETKEYIVKYYIDNQRFKLDKENFSYACDLNRGSLIISNKDELLSVNTSIDNYIEARKADAVRRANNVISVIPAAQRTDAEKDLLQKAAASVMLPVISPDSLKIKKLPDTVDLLGYAVDKYQVIYRNQPAEQLFVTNRLQILNDFDIKELALIEYLLDENFNGYKYAFSSTYLGLIGKSMPMKRIIFAPDGQKIEWQVVKIDEKNISDQEFRKPALFKEITLDQWFKQGTSDDSYYYDDYE